MQTTEPTKLEHAYTIWVKIQEQNFAKKRNDKYDGDELKGIETIATVSISLNSSVIFNIGRAILDAIATFKETYCNALWNPFACISKGSSTTMGRSLAC